MNMKKRNFRLLTLVLSLLALSYCAVTAVFTLTACDGASTPDTGEKENENIDTVEKFELTATVISAEDRLTVNVTDGEYASGIYSVIVADDAKIIDKNGNSIALSDITDGDSLKITYNGQTMMSYPPQIVARKIVKL